MLGATQPYVLKCYIYKSNAMIFLKVREPETEKLVPKRKRRKERVQEAKQISSLQVSRNKKEEDEKRVGIFISLCALLC